DSRYIKNWLIYRWKWVLTEGFHGEKCGWRRRRTDMERLTERLENGVINVKYASQHETAIHRLAAIEDILGDDYDLERLKFIMDAERHGGLIVRYPRDDPGPKGPPGVCPGCGRYDGIS